VSAYRYSSRWTALGWRVAPFCGGHPSLTDSHLLSVRVQNVYTDFHGFVKELSGPHPSFRVTDIVSKRSSGIAALGQPGPKPGYGGRRGLRSYLFQIRRVLVSLRCLGTFGFIRTYAMRRVSADIGQKTSNTATLLGCLFPRLCTVAYHSTVLFNLRLRELKGFAGDQDVRWHRTTEADM
jgi:hypothetical protein